MALAWAAQIFIFSTEPFKASASQSFLAGTLIGLDLSVSKHTLSLMNLLWRKLAHLGQYFIFGLLLYRSFGSWSLWRPDLAGWSLLAAAIYAFTDEFHQAFVPGRGSSLVDCGIDTAGAAAAMLLIYRLARDLNSG